MSRCKKNQEILNLYSVGEASIEDFDFRHAARCKPCQEALEDATRLKSLLEAYASTEDQRAEALLARPKNRSRWHPPRWLALAATVLVLLAGSLLIRLQPQPTSQAQATFVNSLEKEVARVDLQSYLQRSATLLTALMGAGYECPGGGVQISAEKDLAGRLLYQKKLLEPQLRGASLQDIASKLDEFELILIRIVGSSDCVEREELELWRDMIERRATLINLNLLQIKGRI